MSPLIAIVGPTASGKTALGIELAKKNNGAVISADSRQVYAGMNIGTGKPEEAHASTPHDALVTDIISGVPHYLLNVALPSENYTLSTWQSNAQQVLSHLTSQKQLPFLVGGTMLYVDSIIFNFNLPQVPPNLPLREQLATQDTATLYAKLIAKDPEAAHFIEPHHAQRIIRALEVIDATGQRFSALRIKRPSPHTTLIIGLFPGWDVLQKNIRERAEQMLQDGLIDEVNKMRDYFTTLPLLKTLNYKQAGDSIDAKITRDEALEQMVRVNMQYAKRQMAWWKNRTEIQWFQSHDSPNILTTVSQFLSSTTL